MIHYVPLGRLPDDLSFPDNLKARFWYDESRKSLAFDGFMSKATFDRSWQLSNDSEYRRALEQNAGL